MHTATTPQQARMPTATPSLWQRTRRWLMPVVALVVLGVLVSNAHKVDWTGAWKALKSYDPVLLLEVLGIATASHLLYGCFDLISRAHTRHTLPRLQTWGIAVVSYACTLNLGALIGGIGARVRLYTRAGLDEVAVAQIVAVSAATNWLGFGLLAGGLFAFGAIAPPPQTHLGVPAFRALGIVMVLLAAAYVVAGAVSKGRQWTIRHRKVRFPSPRIALLQLIVSSANWSLMGAAMYLLLGTKVPYAVVLSVLMAASIVGVVTPIPAGLGLLEAVFLALLSGRLPQHTVLGAVLAYRALYYLVPLAGALVFYAALERRASHGQAESGRTAV